MCWGEKKKTVQEFYFKLRNFLHLAEEADEHYRMYCDFDDDGGFWLHLFCVDPSPSASGEAGPGGVPPCFSPRRCFRSIITRNCSARRRMCMPSTRSPCLIRAPGNLHRLRRTSRYTRRSPEEYEKYAAYISRIVSCRNGNYMVFFPVLPFSGAGAGVFQEDSSKAGDARGADTEVICQTSGMTEEEKEAFLEKFEEERGRNPGCLLRNGRCVFRGN